MVCSLVSISFNNLPLEHPIKNKWYKTSDYRSRGMLNFDFLEKGLGIVSQPHFVYNFLRTMFFYDIFYQLTKFHCLFAFAS